MTDTPPKAPPIKYVAHHGTRLQKEKEATGRTFDFPDDPSYVGQWIVGECVGKGASGRVRIAKHRRSGQLAALKIIPLQPMVDSHGPLARRSDKQRLGIDREIIMLKLLDHPNIMRIYDVFEGEQELYLVLEYVEGGELFDFLVNHGRLSSRDALVFFKQIIYGLNYAHTFSISHRDLKPENILIQSLTPPLIKIADWGMATFAPPSIYLGTSCGSPHYASPEIISGSKYQGCATDVWSCGVILYALLAGRLPFDDKDVHVLLYKVREGKYEIPKWIDPRAKDLLKRMLVVDVAARITLQEIITHPWFNQYTPNIPYMPPPTLTEMIQPLASEAQIDENLLQCLHLIWGKNGDVEVIKADLLSPQSSLAKAFYFLLHRHHEQILGDNDIIDLKTPNHCLPGKVVTKRYQSPTLSKRNTIEVQQRLPGLTVQTYRDCSSSRTSNPHPKGLSRPPASPTGPRSPKIRHSSPSTAISVPTRRRSMRIAPVSVRPSSVHADVGIQRTRSVSTRPALMNRDSPNYHTYSHEPCEPMGTHQTSIIRFPVIRNSAHPVSSPNTPPPTFVSAIMHDNISTPGPTALRCHESQPAPEYGTSQARGFLELYPVAQDREYTNHVHRDAYISAGPSMRSSLRSRPAHASVTNDTRFRRGEDKENIFIFCDQFSKRDTDWTQHSGRLFVKSIGGVFRQQNQNNPHGQQNLIAGSKGKEKKGRTPTVDVGTTKRPVLGPQHQVDMPSTREFKDWFSKLFHWKPHTFVFYSTAPCHVTRDETIRILEQLGVEIALGNHCDRRHGTLTNVLNCQAHDLMDQSSSAVVQKYVRFRVEFSSLVTLQEDGFLAPPAPPTSVNVGSYAFHPAVLSAAASATSAMLTSSGHIGNKAATTNGMSHPTCAIILAQEKGSGSTFRALCQQFREAWTLVVMASSPRVNIPSRFL